MSRNRLGELLVREKRISLEQLREAQKHQKDDNISLGYALARLGAISDQEITDFLSEQYRVQSIDLSEYEIDREILKLISPQVCERHKIIPVSRAGSSLIVAMADPSNLNAIDDVKFLTGYNVEPVVSSESAILAALEKAYAQPEISYDDIMEGFDESEIEVATTDDDDNLLDLERASEDAPVVRLCNAILLNAIKQGASDIHVEPYERVLRVRYRVDGVLHEEMTPPIKLKNAIASRLKIMSSLDIAERRLPQDGRIKLKLGKGREMDYRVSSVPTLWGEKIVLRLLDKSNLQLDMTKLGFEQKPLSDFRDSIHQPFGMVLVTGPTGSGKTTTLYSAMSDLNEVGTNVSTAEDPIEFNLMGINQVQMHEDIGLNFAAALRSFLRQDSLQFWALWPVLEYARWAAEADATVAYQQYRQQLQLLQTTHPGRRWVLKSPMHFLSLETLLETMPEATVVLLHRHPSEVLPSLLSLFATTQRLTTDAYDRAAGVELTRQVMVDRAAEAVALRDGPHCHRFLDVAYADLRDDPVGTARTVQEWAGYQWTPRLDARARRWDASHPQHAHGRHRYSLGEHGLDGDKLARDFAPYVDRFLTGSRG